MESEAYKKGFFAASGIWFAAMLLAWAYALIFMEVEFSNTAGFNLSITTTVEHEIGNMGGK